jgi:hypothetical protein
MFVRGAIQKFPKYSNKNYYVLPGSYSAPWSAHTDPSVSATFDMHPGSLSLLRCLVPSAILLEFPQLFCHVLSDYRRGLD